MSKLDPEKLVALFKEVCRFDETMGLELAINDGRTTYSVKIDDRHCSAPGICHGGVISGMMDATLGMEALAYAVTKDMLCATVEFKINFIKPAHTGDRLIGSAEKDYIGKSLVVTNAKIINEKSGELVAKGMGTFNLYPMEKRKDFLSWG